MRDSSDSLHHPVGFLSYFNVHFFVDEFLPGLVNEPGLVVATLFEKFRIISFYLLKASAAKTSIKLASKIGELKQQAYLGLRVGIPLGDWNEIGILYEEQINFLRNNGSDRSLNVAVQEFLTQDEKMEKVLFEWDKKILREKLNPDNAV